MRGKGLVTFLAGAAMMCGAEARDAPDAQWRFSGSEHGAQGTEKPVARSAMRTALRTGLHMTWL